MEIGNGSMFEDYDDDEEEDDDDDDEEDFPAPFPFSFPVAALLATGRGLSGNVIAPSALSPSDILSCTNVVLSLNEFLQSHVFFLPSNSAVTVVVGKRLLVG